MPHVYHVVTGNYLHRSRKIFQTIEEVYDHINKIIDLREPWVKDSKLECSIRIHKIDEAVLPRYDKIFRETDKILPPTRPTNTELGIKPQIKAEISSKNEKTCKRTY